MKTTARNIALAATVAVSLAGVTKAEASVPTASGFSVASFNISNTGLPTVKGGDITELVTTDQTIALEKDGVTNSCNCGCGAHIAETA